MEKQKTFFVTGGTGKQGGSVAKHLAEGGFKVKVLTRNPNSVLAQKMAREDLELVSGDLNQPETYRQHLLTVDGIFSVQTFENGIETEIKQGINLANLAKEYKVPHFIYSSVVGANLSTGIPHWESKGIIENHIKNLNLPYTIIRPASFYENFLIPDVKSRLLKGKLVMPVNKNVVQQFISTADIGLITSRIFAAPQKYMGQTITLAAGQYDLIQVAETFSRTLGKEIKYQKLPGLITRLVMGKNLYKMFTWINEHGGLFDNELPDLNKEFPNLMSLEQWVKLNFKQV